MKNYKADVSYDRLIEVLSYDRISGEFVWNVDMGKNKTRGIKAGVVAPDGYRKIRLDRVIYQAHRLTWLFETKHWPADEIDHINGDRSDNRWLNIRLATHQQNMMNTGAKKRKREGSLKGAFKAANCNRWVARIVLNNVAIHLGMHATEKEAHEAYKNAVVKYHGEFARV